MTAVIVPPALDAAAAEAKAYLRVAGADEDALIERLIGTGAALCEAFTGRWLLAREGAQTIPVGPVPFGVAQDRFRHGSGQALRHRSGQAWRRLRATPVASILGIDAVLADGAAVALAPEAYAVDIDANGDGWVRVIDSGTAKRVRVRFEAGMASEWGALPEPLRQGIVRLAAHLFTHRSDGKDAGPPAAVTALWRPWQRLRLS